MIKPTIGRRVWYWPNAFDLDQVNNKNYLVASDHNQPCDAGIAYVHGDRMVNLSVTDHNGATCSRCSVTLLQEGDTAIVGMAYAAWMPYQVGLSAKPVTLETKLKPDAGAVLSPLPVIGGGDGHIERQIREAGAYKAPRVTPQEVEAAIVGETYTVLPSGRVTVCELTLDNGFTVRGESAVVFVENFDAEIGRTVARQNAINQVWQLLGFRLREKHRPF